jgi:hypothetical protein
MIYPMTRLIQSQHKTRGLPIQAGTALLPIPEWTWESWRTWILT